MIIYDATNTNLFHE